MMSASDDQAAVTCCNHGDDRGGHAETWRRSALRLRRAIPPGMVIVADAMPTTGPVNNNLREWGSSSTTSGCESP
jgi:hypothetical protein